MKCKSTAVLMALGLIAVGLLAKQGSALEIITVEDITQAKIPATAYIKTADNGILLIDTSASMNRLYKDTGVSRLQALKDVLAKRNQSFPVLGVKMGLYVYTPWNSIYPVQWYDREKLIEAIGNLPAEAGGETYLTRALQNLDGILAGLTGRTAVFLVTDGQYTPERHKKKPTVKAKELAEKHNICFYLLSTAEKEQHKRNLQEIAAVNECSRVIPFDVWLERPEYNSGALYVVKSTEKIITFTEERIVGLKTDDILFSPIQNPPAVPVV